jgi:hypothetical protein
MQASIVYKRRGLSPRLGAAYLLRLAAKQEETMTRGLYVKIDPDGTEWVFVEPSGPAIKEEFKRRVTYEGLGGEPPFDDLPTKAKYDLEKV